MGDGSPLISITDTYTSTSPCFELCYPRRPPQFEASAFPKNPTTGDSSLLTPIPQPHHASCLILNLPIPIPFVALFGSVHVPHAVHLSYPHFLPHSVVCAHSSCPAPRQTSQIVGCVPILHAMHLSNPHRLSHMAVYLFPMPCASATLHCCLIWLCTLFLCITVKGGDILASTGQSQILSSTQKYFRFFTGKKNVFYGS